VGKSSLLNMLVPSLGAETAAISMKLGRGKHTTRHVELIRVGSGFVADTPGFSQLNFAELGVEEIAPLFREFAPLADECRFRGCKHLQEPGCAVRDAVEAGTIALSRYEDYIIFINELKDQKRRY
jgi:ribosome biogenesis GTPase